MEKRKAMKYYYYLHVNGDMIGKNAAFADDSDFFRSDLVKMWWLIETDYRTDLWVVILEALALGARLERIKKLAETWKATKEDAFETMAREKLSPEQRKGLTIFIENIVGMSEDDFFKEFERWAEAQKKGEADENKA